MASKTVRRGGYCTTRRPNFSYCTRRATVIATDPSGEREVCAHHAEALRVWGEQRRIEALCPASGTVVEQSGRCVTCPTCGRSLVAQVLTGTLRKHNAKR